MFFTPRIFVSALATSALASPGLGLLLSPNIESWPKHGVKCGEGANSFEVSLEHLKFAYANNPQEYPAGSGIWRGETEHKGVYAYYTITQGQPVKYNFKGAYRFLSGGDLELCPNLK